MQDIEVRMQDIERYLLAIVSGDRGSSPAKRAFSIEIMALHRLVQLSSLLRSAVSVTLRRNMGLSAVLLNRADLDPVQRLFVDKIRDYNTKSKATAGGVVDGGAAYQKNVSEEMTKLQRLYGGGDLGAFPDFKFQDPKFDEVAK
ncbi:ATP synthase-coupling factor 6, mitochondrial [Merluccius polli]|uniref:ATP synthase peripheral stalk subunit F6, mitochondrial n=1 Tax=Merluccius polli TaxID=89951 RepID=A0AA47P5K7_MERPO|nr:ATP synthase-coupling factor 6, mitochondrial [Merluccius polli]